ncbi:MAG: phosphodiester glycosidase family protein [Chloroflexi bacterium]|nr:phosphodiester glycosidase family protein [Chloroflexota bacterium]
MKLLPGYRIALLATLLALLACNMPALAGSTEAEPSSQPTEPLPATALPLPTLPPLEPGPPTATVSAEWQVLAPGLAIREVQMPVARLNGDAEVLLLRIDPSQVSTRVHYDPARPATLDEWQSRTDAPILINGGFFLPDNTAMGLLIADGTRYTPSYDRFGGMLSVSGATAEVRSLSEFPYYPSESLDQAVQGRPLYLYSGRVPADFDFNQDAARRTAVAQDTDGHIIFMVVYNQAVTLYEMRDWLADTPELELWTAVNLDGGASTGLLMDVSDTRINLPAWSRLPIVLGLYPEE